MKYEEWKKEIEGAARGIVDSSLKFKALVDSYDVVDDAEEHADAALGTILRLAGELQKAHSAL